MIDARRRPERRLRRPRPDHRRRDHASSTADPDDVGDAPGATRRTTTTRSRRSRSSSRSRAVAGAEYGGDDNINTGIGRDEIFGGAGNDTIVANNGETSPPDLDDNNIVFGDYGFVDYRLPRLPHWPRTTPYVGDRDAARHRPRLVDRDRVQPRRQRHDHDRQGRRHRHRRHRQRHRSTRAARRTSCSATTPG